MVKLSYAHIVNLEEARKNFGGCYNHAFFLIMLSFCRFLSILKQRRNQIFPFACLLIGMSQGNNSSFTKQFS